MSDYPIRWITENLAVGYAPMSHADLDVLKGAGIDAIVNLCAEFSDLHEIQASAGFEVYYLPVWDEDIPEMRAMEAALAWLDEAIYLEKRVLVHCRHGIGRTGTFVTSYMIRKGMGLAAAKRRVKASGAMPSSYGQWKLLKRYGKQAGVLTIREPALETEKRVDLGIFFAEYESLIGDVEKAIRPLGAGKTSRCGKEGPICCAEPFGIELIEAVYLHAKINRHFNSSERERMIEKAVAGARGSLCPLSDGSDCRVPELRPARCRIYNIPGFAKDAREIRNMLHELSQSLFLSFSGDFMPDCDFTFSAAEAVSGKFVQKYFHYLLRMECQGDPEHP